MRTNAIDSLAWRCLTEFKNLTDILVKLDADEYEGHGEEVIDHITNLYELNDAKSIRNFHFEEIKNLKKRIEDRIDEIKKVQLNVVELG
tara:strand:- start:310 stop:576 length:267 start_codon:yes stop_codon:yes gene_type:complete